MAEAPHGTAPALLGKDIANPMAMILAVAALLHYAGDTTARGDDASDAADRGAELASRAVYEAVLETVAAGTRTPDLGGHAGTTEFTDAVIELIGRKLRLAGISDSAARSREAWRPETDPRSARASCRRPRRWPGKYPARVALGVVLGMAIALVVTEGLHDTAQTSLNGISYGAIYALGAVGLTLVYGILKLVNFAHGDFLTFGAYMAFLINVTWELPFALGVLAAVVVTIILGVALERLMWRPMRGKRGRAAAADADVAGPGARPAQHDPVHLGHRSCGASTSTSSRRSRSSACGSGARS